MIEIRQTDAFTAWLVGLGDRRAQAAVLKRIGRLRQGNAGDAAPVGEGISELRIHLGPGYRVYFIQRGKSLIILLGGGDKATQDRDIRAARMLAAGLEDQA